MELNKLHNWRDDDRVLRFKAECTINPKICTLWLLNEAWPDERRRAMAQYELLSPSKPDLFGEVDKMADSSSDNSPAEALAPRPRRKNRWRNAMRFVGGMCVVWAGMAVIALLNWLVPVVVNAVGGSK